MLVAMAWFLGTVCGFALLVSFAAALIDGRY